MKILKKNQLAILVISLMLITAGYLNYGTTYKEESMGASSSLEQNTDLAALGDAELVNANIVEEENTQENTQESSNEIKNVEVTPDAISNDDYFEASKLERNVMYSQMIERYQNIISSNSEASDQKGIAEQEINKINKIQNAIMIAENLLISKGFSKNIIFVNGDSISVIIAKEELTSDEVAQIQNIVSRELEADVSNIHISVK